MYSYAFAVGSQMENTRCVYPGAYNYEVQTTRVDECLSYGDFECSVSAVLINEPAYYISYEPTNIAELGGRVLPADDG